MADDRGETLDRETRITRLGQGVDSEGRLSSDAIGRTVAVLRDYRSVMERFGVSEARLVATSAVRDAANRADFLEAAGEATGLVPDLLTGTEEGRLSLAGAVSEFDPREGPFLVVDVGGGSTELVAGSGPDDPDLVAVSLQIGCVRVTERFFRSDPPPREELGTAEAAVDYELAAAESAHPPLSKARRLVGLAGTVSTLAALQLGLRDYDRSRIHHAVLRRSEVANWYRSLATETAASRLDRAGMVSGREDVIVGGALILDAVMRRFEFEECLVSESDILDGIVAGLLRG